MQNSLNTHVPGQSSFSLSFHDVVDLVFTLEVQQKHQESIGFGLALLAADCTGGCWAHDDNFAILFFLID